MGEPVEVGLLAVDGGEQVLDLLRDALAAVPEEDTGYSEAQQQAMWRAKNAFRDRLRLDVQWLFREDELERKRRARRSSKREKTTSKREKTPSRRG